MRYLLIPILLVVSTAANAQATDGCGEVVTIPTHSGTTTRYAFAPAKDAKIGLVMLIGGGGYMNLDDQGCPRLLSRNVLVRMRPLLNEAGIVTALVDAPSDMKTEEGLGGFRIASGHAEDLGKVIAELRARINGPVWIVGHSRGSLSAANTAARLNEFGARQGVAAREVNAWTDAFAFIQMLRLRHQPLQKAQGKTMDNRVNPADLNAPERHILKQALRQAREVQRRMTLDYVLQGDRKIMPKH